MDQPIKPKNRRIMYFYLNRLVRPKVHKDTEFLDKMQYHL